MHTLVLNKLAALSLGLACAGPLLHGPQPLYRAYRSAQEQIGLEQARQARGLSRAPQLLLPH